jgi:lipopolysaccharide transport system ATP-binding protein
VTIAIKIENLSKQYRLGLVSTRTLSHDLNRWYQTTIRGKDDPYLKISEGARERGSERSDEIFNTKTPRREENNSSLRLSASAVEDKSEITNHKSLITNPFSRPTPHAPCPMPSSDYIWALRDINLEVKQGEVLGIIGKNGAGKSTLLKILSKVTAPTTGSVKAKGRIASLLEVGTGFHPEMTGRENIYMNGAIMGMSKAEITRKLDEIIDFAGVEQFIDTPIKRYSSGMTVRLGFAVAAHLEPEILVVDEVLAVGDAEFQKKAIGKMQEVSRNEGRTVLFVSHNMAAVTNLCPVTLLLENGRRTELGTTEDVIRTYLQKEKTAVNDIRNIRRYGSKEMIITRFYTGDTFNDQNRNVTSGENVTLNFEYEKDSDTPVEKVSLGFSLHNSYGDVLSILYSDFTNDFFEINNPTGAIRCKIEKFPFSAGRYWVGLRVIRNGIEMDYPQDKIGFIDVINGDFYGTGKHDHSGLGPVLLKGEWAVE